MKNEPRMQSETQGSQEERGGTTADQSHTGFREKGRASEQPSLHKAQLPSPVSKIYSQIGLNPGGFLQPSQPGVGHKGQNLSGLGRKMHQARPERQEYFVVCSLVQGT